MKATSALTLDFRCKIFCLLLPMFTLYALMSLSLIHLFAHKSDIQMINYTSNILAGNLCHQRTLSPSENWIHETFCNVDCPVGKPCAYKDEVDFRIILLTYNRAYSVQNCLKSISRVDMMGQNVSIDIWIDSKRTDHEDIDPATLSVVTRFKESISSWRICIHKRERNAYIDGQWIDTWKPKPGTKEIALILEDDVDISAQTFKWLKAVHERYDAVPDIAGYTLQMENTIFFAGKKRPLQGPKSDSVFLYGALGTWGFSPRADSWRQFQDWFHCKNSTIKPYVPGILPTYWYKRFEKKGSQRSMWEMWHIYFSYINELYTIYCNLHVKMNRSDINLSSNRKENGLHYTRKNNAPSQVKWAELMQEWKQEYIEFPKTVIRYQYDGKVIMQK